LGRIGPKPIKFSPRKGCSSLPSSSVSFSYKPSGVAIPVAAAAVVCIPSVESFLNRK